MTPNVIWLRCSRDEIPAYTDAFNKHLPEFSVKTGKSPDCAPEDIQYFAGWLPPEDLFERAPNVKALFNLGAGVDHIQKAHWLQAPLAEGRLDLVRVIDGGMANQIAQYAAYGVLHFSRQFNIAARQQADARWTEQPFQYQPNFSVGVLGLGALGQHCAQTLAQLGYRTLAWSRKTRPDWEIDTFTGVEQLEAFLSELDALVCILPGGDGTRHLIDATRLSQLKSGAIVINCGRGEVIETDALVAALTSGHLGGALLDVFEHEPLPTDHPLWTAPNTLLTPHIAAKTLPEEAVIQFADYVRQHPQT